MGSPFGNRRRSLRQPAGWLAEYRAPVGEWGPCRAIDVSEHGARLELFGPAVNVGQELLLGLDVKDGEVGGAQLPAIVKNASTTADGSYRVGIEFADLSTWERETLLGLLLRRARAER